MSIILTPGLVLGTEGGEGLVSWRRREQSYCVIEAGRKRERGLGGRQEGRKRKGGRVRDG